MEQFDIKKIKAVIGLGNPGSKYSKNRHNIGFMVIDELANQHSASWQSADNLEYAKIDVDSHSLYLVKPLTFMNVVGKVIPFLAKKGIKAEEILVIHDELEKKVGNVSLKFGGSARGHNGLRSIISMIGSDFFRLRFGIGRPDEKSEVSNYVLSNFSIDEQQQLDQLIQKSVEMILHQ